MTEQEIERCLERFTIGKATDVMNFDYSGTLAYLQRLKAENDKLRDRLRITKMALEYSCLESVQGNEKFLDELKEKVNKYIEKAEDIFNSEKNGITFTFAEVRLKGEKK